MANQNEFKYDLTGLKINKLTVIKRAGKNKTNDQLWFCECECGGTITTRQSSLRSGRAKSCGCLFAIGKRPTLFFEINGEIVANPKGFFVYTLSDPETNQVKYVGATGKLYPRYMAHVRPATYYDKPGVDLVGLELWKRGLFAKNQRPNIEILDQYETLEQCREGEIYWISQFKAWGFDLCNQSVWGGKNMVVKTRDSVRKKISATLKSKKLTWVNVNRKPVSLFSHDGTLIQTFASRLEAKKITGYDLKSIVQAMKGEIKSKLGVWKDTSQK